MRRYGLHDDEWDRIKDLLPGRLGHVGVTAADNRLFVEAFCTDIVTGCVNRRIDGEACAGEDKGRSRPLDLFNGMAIQGDGLPVASSV